MATHCRYSAFSPFQPRDFYVRIRNFRSRRRFKPIPINASSVSSSGESYRTLVSEAARILVPTASFEPSKLKVVFLEEWIQKCSGIIPRTYILSHCDFTANLTLTISSVINLDQLKGWYNKDDVIAEWKKVKDDMFLNVHCYVSGPNLMLDLAAEFRYHIFSKELPLVLKALLHGDSILFRDHPQLMDALVCVYFHSSAPKYNQMECWGPLKDAAEVGLRGRGFPGTRKGGSITSDKFRRPKSILQTMFTFFL